MDNRSLSHTRWKCQYHIVFIPKYRKKALYGKVREDVREILITLCKYKNVDIIAGAVCTDHVHLSVAIPPKLSISNFMGYLKGKSTLMIYDRHAVPLLPRPQAVFRFRGLSHNPLPPAQRTVSNGGRDCSLSLWLVQA